MLKERELTAEGISVTNSEKGSVVISREKEGMSRQVATADGTVLCECGGTLREVATCLATATTGLEEAVKLSPDTRLVSKITEKCARLGQVCINSKVGYPETQD